MLSHGTVAHARRRIQKAAGLARMTKMAVEDRQPDINRADVLAKNAFADLGNRNQRKPITEETPERPGEPKLIEVIEDS